MQNNLEIVETTQHKTESNVTSIESNIKIDNLNVQQEELLQNNVHSNEKSIITNGFHTMSNLEESINIENRENALNVNKEEIQYNGHSDNVNINGFTSETTGTIEGITNTLEGSTVIDAEVASKLFFF